MTARGQTHGVWMNTQKFILKMIIHLGGVQRANGVMDRHKAKKFKR